MCFVAWVYKNAVIETTTAVGLLILAQTGQFQTPTSLVFRLIGRGHSLANSLQLNVFYVSIEYIYEMQTG